MKTLETLIEEANGLYAVSMDDRYDEDFQDEAYGLFHEKLKDIAAKLEKITCGKINGMVALRMAAHKRSEILSLIKEQYK